MAGDVSGRIPGARAAACGVLVGQKQETGASADGAVYELTPTMPPVRTSAAALALVLGLAAPAQAGKPTVEEFSRCDTIGPDSVLCAQGRIVTKTIETKGGPALVFVRSRISSQFTSPSCEQQQFERSKEFTFAKDAAQQLFTTRSRLRIDGTCFDPEGAPTECLQTTRFLAVKGEVKVDRFEFTCEPARS